MAASVPIARLLRQTAFSAADCQSALLGERLPENLGNQVVQLCLISGIRQHIDFARSAAVAGLCRAGAGGAIFARARNARLIMSGEVPSRELMPDRGTFPYCVWYPDVASEDTYRKLVATFPDMRYQVGRACAVAGYARLYGELDLLPDPSIAEEAREAGKSVEGSRQIFERIIAAPARYSVMNDYNLTVQLDNPVAGAFLNADTAVRATLEGRKKFVDCFAPWRYFNITEDWGIGLETTPVAPPAQLTDEETALLESPLPRDLPTMRKDLLILAAAYEGNLDRYARLRRPGRSVLYELHCLVPGVYRSTALALWLGRNPDVAEVVAAAWDGDAAVLRKAIHARHVMNNDTRRLLNADPPVPDDDLPYWIWYPTVPSAHTLCELARARKAMRPQCARACIAGGYRRGYVKIMDMDDHDADDDDEFALAADPLLAKEAESSPDRDFFIKDMQRRREERGLKMRRIPPHDRWKGSIPWRVGDTASTVLYGGLVDGGSCVVHEGQDWGMWEDLGAELGRVRLYLSSPAEERAKAVEAGGAVILEDHT
ncbi:hypothetical protein F4679DRAFT_481431 [Xylaria curta]|nr:hypothetical protein F4679DRAFT_481431 [Xylaria curta]